MRGDFSRFLFDPTKHYVAVLHQQGRVWLDSDWNEDVLQRLALVQQQLIDVVGPCGIPAPGTAFQLTASANANADDFRISAGRCYVNGIPCQLEANASYLTQPDFPNPPRIAMPNSGGTLAVLVYLEVWHRPITYLEDQTIREVALGGPDTSTRLKTVVQVKAKALPAGVGSLNTSQAAQFLPVPGSGTLTTLQPANTAAQTPCQLPDPSNFTGTENRLYRVQIHDGGDITGGTQGFPFSVALRSDVAAGAISLSLATALTSDQIAAAGIDKFVVVSDSSGLSERARLTAISTDGTTLTLAAPLTRAYLKANNATVASGIARFKWSRDNASFAVQITTIADPKTLTLDSLGRDAATTLRQGDLVEITDDAAELGPARGHLTYLAADPDPDQFTVVLQDPLPAELMGAAIGSPPNAASDLAGRHVVLRRWDGVGDAAAAFSDATPGMNLGDGVHIQFGGWDLRPGDYWQFATRTADGSVQALNNARPAGIERSWCPLAVVQWVGPPAGSPPSPPTMTVLLDCRSIFPSLVNFPAADGGVHITGLFTVNPATNAQLQLQNDTNVQTNVFGGIDVVCDAAIDPVSIARPTFSVSIKAPVLGQTNAMIPLYYQTIELAGETSVNNGNIISWRPADQAAAQTFITQLAFGVPPGDRGILTRAKLSGDFIWSQNDPSQYLDGEAFGRHEQTNNIGLTLPSGNRKRGGDFEFWFWLVGAPSFATSAAASPNPIYVGDISQITVVLSSFAPTAAPLMTVTSSNAAVATVPAQVTVSAGVTSVTFPVTGHAAGQSTISIAFDTRGGTPTPVTTTLTVIPLPNLTGSLGLSPSTIFEGDIATGTVTLTGPAPAAGVVVQLASAAPGVATVQAASITVPAGAVSQSFNITGVAAGQATITASTAAPSPISSASAVITVQKRPKSAIQDKNFIIDKASRIEKQIAIEQVATKVGTIEAAAQPKSAEIVTTTTKISGSAPDAIESLAPEVAAIDRAPKSEAFIRPEERPAVDQTVIDASDNRAAA